MGCKTFCLSLTLFTLACLSVAQAKTPTPNEQFLNAIELRDSGNLYQAIDILEHLLNTSPRLDRARLELAVAYYRAAFFDDALKAAERVLNAPNTPKQVKDTIQLFLAEVAASKQADAQNRHKVSGIMTAGLGHDDNVNVGPNSNSIDTGNFQLEIPPDSAPQSDLFGVMSAQINHTYRVPGSMDLGGKPVQRLWQSGFSLYRKQYETENDFHVDVISIGTGPALLSQSNWWAKLDLQADYVRLGDDTLGIYTTISPSYTFLRNKNEITLKASWTRRAFSDESNEGMDGNRIGLGAELMHPINNKWTTQLNADIYIQDSRDKAESYNAYELAAALYWRGWNDGTLYTKATHTKSDYSGDAILFGRSRDEHENSIELGINHDFREGEWENWGLNTQVTYTENHSNIGLYDYDRTILLIQAIRKF